MSIYSEHFETVFSTKQNIQALRNKVLELAVQGKLVEQDQNDEPASILIERITEEKIQLIHNKQIKKEKVLPEITVELIPYVVPVGWEWVRLNEILDVRDGTHDTPKYVPEGIPLVTSKNLKNGEIDFSNVKYISESDHASIEKRSRVDDNDILFAMIGSIGNAVVVKKDNDFSIKNMALFKNYPNRKINMQYVKIYLDAIEDNLKQQASGGVQSFLSLKYLRELLLPLPPIAEQTRIVSRIESLMAEIDQLERYLVRKERLKEAVPKAVVSAISNCQNEEELKSQLGLVIEHFTEIFQTPESLQELRNVILQLAIQGKLVPQNHSDEPTSELLKRIQAEKELLIKEKKIKKEKSLPEIRDDEIPFEIPDSWEWVKLGEVTNYGNTLTVIPENISDETWVLDLEDIESKSSKILKVNYNLSKRVKSNKNAFVKGDVLYGKLRPYLLKVLVAPTDGVCTSEIIPFRGYGEIDSRYVVSYLKSSYADKTINGMTYGMKMPRLGTIQAKNLLMPLPPVDEQKRIVDKCETLFAVIDKLEKELRHNQHIVKAMVTV